MLFLYIDFKEHRHDVMSDVSTVFTKQCKASWLQDDFASEVIGITDIAKFTKNGYIDHPIFGNCDASFLSDYAKYLITMKNCPGNLYLASKIHTDCVELLYKLSKEQDVHLLYDIPLKFVDKQMAYLPDQHVILKSDSAIRSAFDLYHKDKATFIRCVMC